MKIAIVVTDLWPEPEGGWSANGAMMSRYMIEVPEDLSDLAVVHRIKEAAGIQGWRRDEWCVCDFGPWRSRDLGAYADIIFDLEEGAVVP